MSEIVQVEFQGQNIDAVWDGENAWVVVKRICENLGIDHSNQNKKIQSNKAYEQRYSAITIPSEGGEQETFCLRLDALTLWLASIQPNRVKEEVRDLLIQYQRECMQVLNDHFFGAPKSTVPVSAAQQLLAQAQLLVQQEERLAALEERMDKQDELREQAEEKMLALPAPGNLPLPRSRRSELVEYVRQACYREDMSHQSTWNKLYREFMHRSRVDLKARALNRKLRPLDVAESEGYIEQLYDLACWLWPQRKMTPAS